MGIPQSHLSIFYRCEFYNSHNIYADRHAHRAMIIIVFYFSLLQNMRFVCNGRNLKGTFKNDL